MMLQYCTLDSSNVKAILHLSEFCLVVSLFNLQNDGLD